MKLVKRNSGVSYHYDVLEEYITGIILNGNEIKPIKNGFISFVDSYIVINNNKVILKNLHVNLRNPSISRVSFDEKAETRDRELLLKKFEIEKIRRKVNEKGLTIVPLEVSLDRSFIKVKIGVCKGKKVYEKKNILKERDIKREMDREMKRY